MSWTPIRKQYVRPVPPAEPSQFLAARQPYDAPRILATIRVGEVAQYLAAYRAVTTYRGKGAN